MQPLRVNDVVEAFDKPACSTLGKVSWTLIICNDFRTFLRLIAKKVRSAPVWGTLQPFNVSVSAIFLLSFQNQSVGDRGQWSQLSCFWTHRSSSSRGETSLPQRLHNKGKIQPLHNTLQISNLDSNKELARLPNSLAVTNGLRSLTIQILHNTEKKDLDKILSNHIQGYTKKNN